MAGLRRDPTRSSSKPRLSATSSSACSLQSCSVDSLRGSVPMAGGNRSEPKCRARVGHGRARVPRSPSRSAREWLRGKAYAEALDEAGNARRVHLERLALAQLAEDGRVGLRDAPEVDQLSEETLKARRGDDLEDPARAVPSVPEGGPPPNRLE